VGDAAEFVYLGGLAACHAEAHNVIMLDSG
jgi:hypothetical protein